MRNRKRKNHIRYGGYGACGVYLQTVYDPAAGQYVATNGRTTDKITSACYVTCKNCRKTWEYSSLKRGILKARLVLTP